MVAKVFREFRTANARHWDLFNVCSATERTFKLIPIGYRITVICFIFQKLDQISVTKMAVHFVELKKSNFNLSFNGSHIWISKIRIILFRKQFIIELYPIQTLAYRNKRDKCLTFINIYTLIIVQKTIPIFA